MFEWIKKRIVERSTWVGIMSLAGLIGYNIKPELQEQILTAITAVVAVVFTITSDKKRVEVVNDVKTVSGEGAPSDTPERNIDTEKRDA
jgi:hypothetical protein